MNIIIADHYDNLCEVSADIVKKCVRTQESAVLGLATGSTPIGLYKSSFWIINPGMLIFQMLLHLIWMNMSGSLDHILKVITNL